MAADAAPVAADHHVDSPRVCVVAAADTAGLRRAAGLHMAAADDDLPLQMSRLAWI
jgi:hypothetical protein